MPTPYYKFLSTSSLEHYGIKGMHWGIRRTPEQLGHVKKSRSSKTGYIKGQSYDRDITFPKGTVGYRVQATNKLNPNRPLYLSYDKGDHVSYLATAIRYPDYGIAEDSHDLENDGKINLYSVELKAKEEIKAPSFQSAMEIFVEMVGDYGVKDINPYSAKSIAGSRFIQSWKTRGNRNSGAESAYTSFVDNLRNPNKTKFYQEFTKRLEEKGYNAIVDPEDRKAFKNMYGEYDKEAPMIILNPKKSLEISKSTKLSQSDLRYFANFDMDVGDINWLDKLIQDESQYQRRHGLGEHEKWKKWYNS